MGRGRGTCMDDVTDADLQQAIETLQKVRDHEKENGFDKDAATVTGAIGTLKFHAEEGNNE